MKNIDNRFNDRNDERIFATVEDGLSSNQVEAIKEKGFLNVSGVNLFAISTIS